MLAKEKDKSEEFADQQDPGQGYESAWVSRLSKLPKDHQQLLKLAIRTIGVRRGFCFRDRLCKTAIALLSVQDMMAGDEIAGSRSRDPRASIALVGVRGAGKRSIAFIAATHLRWRLITDGSAFYTATGMTKLDFLKANGAAKLAARSHAVLAQMLADHPTEYVIDCGSFSLTDRGRSLLRSFAKSHPVIHVTRPLEDRMAHLALSDDDGRRLLVVDDVHRECSNYQYHNLRDPGAPSPGEVAGSEQTATDQYLSLRSLQIDVRKYMTFVTGKGRTDADCLSQSILSKTFPELRPRSYVTTLYLSDLPADSNDWHWTSCVEDVIEFVIDAVDSASMSRISTCIAELRRTTDTPIMYSLPDHKGGADVLSDELSFQILEHGLRQAVDYLAVPLELPREMLRRLIRNRGWTRIIGHSHFGQQQHRGWLHTSRYKAFNDAAVLGVDIVRLTQEARSRSDNAAARRFRDAIADVRPVVRPILIAYNIGEMGRTSVIDNPVFSPVQQLESTPQTEMFHSKLSVKQITTALFHNFELDPLRFFIIGKNTSYSRSPDLYSAAFEALGLLHTFTPMSSIAFEEALQLWRQDNWGGSPVSFPYKEQAYKACTATSTHAQAIGSVNTVVPLRTSDTYTLADRYQSGAAHGFYGENSDWYGIYKCIERSLSPRNLAAISSSSGLVLGAGGSARAAIYSLLQLNCRNVFVLNRTTQKARDVADHFNTWTNANHHTKKPVIHVLQHADPGWPTGFELPIIVIACIPTSSPGTQYEIPPSWLQSPYGGVVVDVTYKPVHTLFLQYTRRCQGDRAPKWAVVNGLDIMLEQAVVQFETMIARPAPRSIIRAALNQE